MKVTPDPGTAILVVEFKEHLKIKNYSPKSIQSYFLCIIKFILWMEKTLDKRVKEITREDILSYGVYLKEQNYSYRTIERHMVSVRTFFKWLEEKLYILINPCENMIIPRAPQTILVVLTENEIKKILSQPNTSTLIGIRDKAMLEVFYSTGIRIGELYNLTIFDIDLSGGFLRVNKGKCSKDRFAPLTKAACIYLKEYISKVRPRFTKNKIKEQGLFLGAKGVRLHTVLIAKKIREYTKSAGINKKVTAHTFRHTFATHMLENEVDIFKIQRLLGHSRASTTQIYTKVNPKQIKKTHSKHHPREKEKNPDGK